MAKTLKDILKSVDVESTVLAELNSYEAIKNLDSQYQNIILEAVAIASDTLNKRFTQSIKDLLEGVRLEKYDLMNWDDINKLVLKTSGDINEQTSQVTEGYKEIMKYGHNSASDDLEAIKKQLTEELK